MHNVALLGRSELAEIAYLSGHERKVQFSLLIDVESSASFMGLLVTDQISPPSFCNAGIITALQGAQDYYDKAIALWGCDRVLAPKLLMILPAADKSSES